MRTKLLTRDELICHVLMMKQLDADYARYALKQYAALLPWCELVSGVREAMEHENSSKDRQQPAAYC